MKRNTGNTRREFLKTAAVSAAAFTIIPRRVLGGAGYVAPSDTITAACIGVGSQGTRVMMNFLGYDDLRIVSVCDPNRGSNDYIGWGENEIRNKVRKLLDDNSWGQGETGCVCGCEPARKIVDAYYRKKSGSGSGRGCTAYEDYRELLDKETDIDAVIIGTHDAMHAPAAIAAMKKGKHAYCQKPMTRSVYEARLMANTARETKRATQVATGNHASDDTRRLCEWVWAGVIGDVYEVHNWSRRPFWPQGIARPAEEMPVPGFLNWDLWLGPSPSRPFHTIYQPFVWRGWLDFGASAVGDMGCYSFDTIARVLKLGPPASVEGSRSGEYIVKDGNTELYESTESYPRASLMHFHFPAREGMQPVTIHWYDGGIKPPRPAELESGQELEDEGLLFVGTKGKLLCGFNGRRPRLIPDSRMEEFSKKMPPQTLEPSIGHYEEWFRAIRGGEPADANFLFAGPLTETILLGNVAVMTKKTLEWDPVTMKAKNVPAADPMIKPEFRSGHFLS